MRDMGEVLRQVSGPGDAAVVLLAGAGGFVIDAVVSIHGFPSPGAFGVTAAAGALGLKKGWEARVARGRARGRAKKAIRLLEKDHINDRIVARLKEELELCREGLLKDSMLDNTVNEALGTYLLRRAGEAQPGASTQDAHPSG